MYETSYKPSSDPVTSDEISSKGRGAGKWWGSLPPRHKRVVTGLLIVLGLVCVVAIVSAFANRTPSFTGDNVSIELEVPTEVQAGEVFDGVIRVTNTELDLLQDVTIAIDAPAGFALRTSNRTTVTPATPSWQVAQIDSGAVYEIQFQGVIQAQAGSGIELQARLSYSPESVSSVFGANTVATVLLTQSDVSIVTEIPANVSPGGELVYRIAVGHQGEIPLENAAVRLRLPSGFRVLTADPVATNRRDVWNVGTLSDEERVITVRGVLDGESGQSFDFTAQVGVLDASGQLLPQEERVDTVTVVDADVALDLTVNGVSTTSVTADGVIEVALNYRNAGDETLRNVRLEVEASGNDALLEAAEWQVDRGRQEGRKAVFSADTLPELGQLRGGDEGRLLFTIRLPEGATFERGTKNIALTLLPRASASVGAGSSVDVQLDGASAQVKVGTNASIEADIVYYNESGVILGDGPIPPRAGEITTYVARATLRNTTSIVNNVSVQFRLANGVELAANPVASDGSVTTSSRRVTWQLGRLGTEVGSVLPGVTIEFPIRVRPSDSDIGAHVPLISAVSVTGTDGYTQLPISLDVPALDSSLPTDATAQAGLTRVRE